MGQNKFLIVGAGIAGLSVAKQLLERGKNVTVIDSGINKSSAVAAGMINPIVFRRMTKSWRVDEFLPIAQNFYLELEKLTNQHFFYPIQIRRMFSSQQERDFWLDKENLPDFENYLSPVTIEDNEYSTAINQFGSGRVKKSYYVSTIPFLNAVKQWISEQINFIQERINYDDVDPENATYKGIKYDNIIFCEGFEVMYNPWFGKVPINPTKGEILTINSNEITEMESLNRKCFILPIGNKNFRVGATYVWNTTNDDLTSEGRAELEQYIRYLTNSSYTVIDQHAGIRPTTLDRRPFLGKHETYPNLIIFNGLGAKGYLLAPLLAKELIDHLLDDRQLDKEIRYSRLIK